MVLRAQTVLLLQGQPVLQATFTTNEFFEYLAKVGMLSEEDVRTLTRDLPEEPTPEEIGRVTAELVRRDKLTEYQAQVLRDGRSQPLIFADYVVLGRISQGGVGQVYKGMHPAMKRPVAIKVLPNSAIASEATTARFQREVEAISKLEHPNIVAAYDAGQDAAGRPFLVMQYVDGPDLAAFVQEHGPLPVPQAVGYAVQAARGLAYAHGQGMIHRDIKPANLLLSPGGQVKVLDLGLARIAGGDSAADSQVELTRAGDVMGTPLYMSPEQALDSRHADGRSDVYSLGCTLFFLLTGKPVYQSDTAMKALLAHRESPIPTLAQFRSDAPRAVDAIVRKMMAKRPDDRQQSMEEVISALEPFASTATAESNSSLEMTQIIGGASDDTEFTTSPEPETFDAASATRIESLHTFIEGCTAVDGFIDVDEERDVFRKGADLGIAAPEIEAVLHRTCSDAEATRESVLKEKLELLLKQAEENDDSIDQRSYELAIGFAVRRKMQRKKADELCATLMLDNNWRAKEGLFDKWFSTKLRLHGLR